MDMGLMGAPLKMRIDSVTWSDDTGKPVRMLYSTTSGNTTQRVDAKFLGPKVIVYVDNAGTKSQKTLAMPKGGSVVDDPIADLAAGSAKPTSTC